jgi:hypothetical protein
MSKNPPPKPPYVRTNIPGGFAKILRIWEDLRTQNANGYVPGGGLLADIRDHGALAITKGTTCSPFTATVIGLAFDPEYPRKGLPGSGKDVFVPMFNGGKDELPFLPFYHMHNMNNQPVESLVKYGLGYELEKHTEMRRGDLLAIDWNDEGKHGHAVFCWDVHLNDAGEVDCFQYLGANSVPERCGITIGHCAKPGWLDGFPKTGSKAGTLHKVVDPMFVDTDKIVQQGQWLALPEVAPGSINTKTFRVTPQQVRYKTPNTYTVNKIKVARLYYEGAPPAPYCMTQGAAPAKAPGHVDAPAIVVRGPDVKRDPEAPKKVAPEPAKQDKDKPTNWQYYAEVALQVFYKAKWIESDPGKPDAINDAKSQAAIKEFQGKFKLDPDGIVGKNTLGAINRQLPACMQQIVAQFSLGSLYRGKKLEHDPGSPDGVNNPETRAAVEEFQLKNGLDKTGVPDAETLAKIIETCKAHAATQAKPGLEPTLHHLYWTGNTVEPGGAAKLRLHFRDLVIGQECPIHLKDEVSGKEIEAAAKLKVDNELAEVTVPIPSDFGAGCRLHARVTAAISDEGEMESKTSAPLYVRSKANSPIAVVDGDDVYLDPPVRL